MSSKLFRFKQFSISDDRCSHKVGTDAVLLGSWVNIQENDRLLLDIGTGSGVIALMLAQRSHTDARIDAIEIETEDAQQALMNTTQSPWPEKVNICRTALQDFSPGTGYDLIVSNPPFFVDSLLPPDRKRGQARHAHTLSFGDLLVGVKRLLKPQGRFALILPVAEGREFIMRATGHELFAFRTSAFRARAHKPVERLLIEFSQNQRKPEESEIVLYGDGDKWSEGYCSLTKEFYLKV